MIDPTQLGWPPPPPNIDDSDRAKALYQAELGVVANDVSELIDRRKAAYAAYDALHQSVFNAYLDVAKGHLDRVTGRAEFIEKAAGTIATLYTGILAFTYNADLSKGKVFPTIGIAPTLFLGLAIVLATFYLAFLTKGKRFAGSESDSSLANQAINERNDFIKWISQIILRRAPLLQSAAISLGFGVISLPIPYLSVAAPQLESGLWIAVIIIMGLILLYPLLSYLPELKQNHPNWFAANSSLMQ